jgi:CHAT domain-containing protein
MSSDDGIGHRSRASKEAAFPGIPAREVHHSPEKANVAPMVFGFRDRADFPAVPEAILAKARQLQHDAHTSPEHIRELLQSTFDGDFCSALASSGEQCQLLEALIFEGEENPSFTLFLALDALIDDALFGQNAATLARCSVERTTALKLGLASKIMTEMPNQSNGIDLWHAYQLMLPLCELHGSERTRIIFQSEALQVALTYLDATEGRNSDEVAGAMQLAIALLSQSALIEQHETQTITERGIQAAVKALANPILFELAPVFTEKHLTKHTIGKGPSPTEFALKISPFILDCLETSERDEIETLSLLLHETVLRIQPGESLNAVKRINDIVRRNKSRVFLPRVLHGAIDKSLIFEQLRSKILCAQVYSRVSLDILSSQTEELEQITDFVLTENEIHITNKIEFIEYLLHSLDSYLIEFIGRKKKLHYLKVLLEIKTELHRLNNDFHGEVSSIFSLSDCCIASGDLDKIQTLIWPNLVALRTRSLAGAALVQWGRIQGTFVNLCSRVAYAKLKTGEYSEAISAIEGRSQLLWRKRSTAHADCKGNSAFGTQDGRLRRLREIRQAQKREIETQSTLTQNGHHQEAIKTGARIAELHFKGKAYQRAMMEMSSVLPLGDEIIKRVSILLPRNSVAVLPVMTSNGFAIVFIEPTTGKIAPRDILWLDHTSQFKLWELVGMPNGAGRASYIRARSEFRDIAGKDQGSEAFKLGIMAWDAFLARSLQDLWHVLMAPIDMKLRLLGFEPGAHVYFCVTADLAAVPLAAAGRKNRHGKWVCFLDHWVTSLVPSLTSLIDMLERKKAQTANLPISLLAMTDPTRNLLPGTCTPSDNPAWSVFDENTRVGISGHEATVRDVSEKLSCATHASFFCHGRFDPRFPEDGGLVLASDVGTEELLTVTKVRELPLDGLRLVMLCACESGQLDETGGLSEFIGLPGAFLEAGAQTVICGSWVVFTVPMTEIARETFIEERKGASPAAALRTAIIRFRDTDAAQLTMGTAAVPMLAGVDSTTRSSTQTLCNRSSPVFWAPFACWGA